MATDITEKKLSDDRPWLFKKGDDPRRNTKGRPPKKQDDIIKELTEVLMTHKVVLPTKVRRKMNLDTSEITILENILLDWALSLNPAKQQMLIERVFGKVPVRNINENSGFDWTKYVGKFTDAELERIKSGEDPLQILVSKIPDADTE